MQIDVTMNAIDRFQDNKDMNIVFSQQIIVEKLLIVCKKMILVVEPIENQLKLVNLVLSWKCCGSSANHLKNIINVSKLL